MDWVRTLLLQSRTPELLTVNISQSVLVSLPKVCVCFIAIENVLSAFISAATASELLDPDPQLEE